jgi:ABC-2 type transport system permease protein
MSLRKVLAVARWEFMEKIKTKAFIISLIVTPLFMVLMTVVPSLFLTKPDTVTINIGVIDETGEIASRLNDAMMEKFKLSDGRPNYRVISLQANDRDLANKMVLSGQLSSYVVIDSNIFRTRKFEYVSQNISNFKEIERLESTVKDIMVSNELQRHGISPGLIQEISKPVNLQTIKLSKTGAVEKAEAGSGFMMGYVFIIVLALFILTSGQLLVRSVVEEKSNRIVEVLLSSSTADELMSGKILGLSLLGLTQLAIWASIGIAFAGPLAAFITIPDNIWWEVVFFILGFVFYSSIFVMAGAPVTTEQEAQQATQYVSMLLFFPIIFAFLVVQNPNATYIKILSLIPLLAPTMMAFRIPVQSPELWELVVSAAILILSTYLCMIAAGRIFRIGILVYGKRPTMKELMRWAFQKR